MRHCYNCHWVEYIRGEPGRGADLGGDPSPPEEGGTACALHNTFIPDGKAPEVCDRWAPMFIYDQARFERETGWAELVDAAAQAVELHGEDELERYAEERYGHTG